MHAQAARRPSGLGAHLDGLSGAQLRDGLKPDVARRVSPREDLCTAGAAVRGPRARQEQETTQSLRRRTSMTDRYAHFNVSTLAEGAVDVHRPADFTDALGDGLAQPHAGGDLAGVESCSSVQDADD